MFARKLGTAALIASLVTTLLGSSAAVAQVPTNPPLLPQAGTGIFISSSKTKPVFSITTALEDVSTTTYTVVAADCGKLKRFTNAGAVTVTIPDASTTGFGKGCSIDLVSVGAGGITVNRTTSSTLNGATSVSVSQYGDIYVSSDNTNWTYPVSPSAGGGAVSSVFGRTGAVVAALNDYAITLIGGLGTGVATLLGGTASGTGGPAGTAAPTFTGNTTVANLIVGTNGIIIAGTANVIKAQTVATVSGAGTITGSLGASLGFRFTAGTVTGSLWTITAPWGSGGHNVCHLEDITDTTHHIYADSSGQTGTGSSTPVQWYDHAGGTTTAPTTGDLIAGYCTLIP